MTYAHYDMRS